MSILIYAESAEGKFKKVASNWPMQSSRIIRTTVTAVVINPEMFQNYQNTV
jgi:hypothetical protein